MLEKCALFKPSSTAIKNIIGKVGFVFEANKDPIHKEVLSTENIPSEAKILAASMDGVNIAMREKGQSKGRPAERPKKETEKEKELCYKNAMVGSFSFYSGKRLPDGSSERLESRYIAGMPQERAIEFKRQMEDEIAHLLEDPSTRKMKKILLMDGSRALWKYAAENPLYKQFEQVIDFYHTTEHLSKAAEALFGKQSQEAKKWYGRWKGKLLEDPHAPEGILRSMEYHYRQIPKLSLIRRHHLKQERTFFRRNRIRMNYVRMRKNGCPIGSGPVEAACKTIVKNRMCRSGMRWSSKGGQNILSLRSYIKSNRWKSAWKCYKTYALAA